MKKLAIIGVSILGLASLASATTYDDTVGGSIGYPAFAARPTYTLVKSIDFSTDTNNYLEDDIIKVINLPATSVVLNATYTMRTATTNDVWFDIGISGSTTAIKDSLAGTNPIYATETLFASPFIVGAVNDIRLTCHTNDVGHTGVITIKADILNLNEY